MGTSPLPTFLPFYKSPSCALPWPRALGEALAPTTPPQLLLPLQWENPLVPSHVFLPVLPALGGICFSHYLPQAPISDVPNIPIGHI